MMFQSIVDRALKKLHEESDAAQAERDAGQGKDYKPGMEEMPELEKNDYLAMVIAALITIIPVALLVLLGVVLVGYLLFMH